MGLQILDAWHELRPHSLKGDQWGTNLDAVTDDSGNCLSDDASGYTSPTPIGLTPGHLSRAISRLATRADISLVSTIDKFLRDKIRCTVKEMNRQTYVEWEEQPFS